MQLVINGEVIQEQVLTDELLRISGGFEADSPQAGALDPQHLRSAALHNVVERTLLCQAARAEGLRVSDAEAEAERKRRWRSRNNTLCGAGVRDVFVEDMLVRQMIAVLTRHVQRPSRVEVENHYLRHRQEYFLPAAVQAAHIVRNIAGASEEPDAQDALRQAELELARGKSFAQVADRYSDCKGAGGSVGWVARGQMVPDFEEVVFRLRVGERSGIFRTVFGLHLATVLKKRGEGYRPLQEVRSEIASYLFAERRGHVLRQTVAAMEQASEIRFVEESANG